MTVRKALRITNLLAMSAALASPANADIGVPMLAVVWPIAWIAFVPVVLIEAAIARRIVPLNWRRSLLLALKANAVSTLVGMPVTWALAAVVAIATYSLSPAYTGTLAQKVIAVTLESAWFADYGSENRWMVPVAVMVLWVPFFFVSVWIENRVARKLFEKVCWPNVKRWAWTANAASYGLLLLLPLYYLIFPPE